MFSDIEKFWDIHTPLLKSGIKLSDSFKSLFASMTHKEPLKNIRNHEWFKAKVYSQEELEDIVTNHFCWGDW